MRKAAVLGIALAVTSMIVLGGTVFRQQVADASNLMSVFVTNDSSHPVPVHEQNTDANGNIKVHEQGTANVNVANSSLPVSGTVNVGNLPAVQQVAVSDNSVQLDVVDGVSIPANVFADQITHFDATGMQTIRVGMAAGDCTGSVRFNLSQAVAGTDELITLLDHVDVPCGDSVSKSYDVPGGKIFASVTSASSATVWMLVWGRA